MPFGAIRTSEQLSLMAAPSVIRRQVDHEGTLPEVVLNVFEKEDIPGNFCREKVDIVHDGASAGWCDLITDYYGKRMYFDFITLDTTSRNDTRNMNEIPRRERPKGLGLATYLIAIETAHSRGLPF